MKAILVIFSLFLITSLNVYYRSYKEAINTMNFIVVEVISYPTKAVALKSKDIKYSFFNFNVVVDDEIEVGDRVVKEKCGTTLYIYRKDTKGIEVLFKSIEMDDSFFNYRC